MSRERLDRLAIIIVGVQNSGKTSTLKQYSAYYYGKVNKFKQGWRYWVVPFRPKFETIKIRAFILPSSRTEKANPIENIIHLNDLPDVLLLAEQLNGKEYSNTIHFLMRNEYHIKEFNLSNDYGVGVWDRWEDGNIIQKEGKLLQRREQIADYIREFLLRKAS